MAVVVIPYSEYIIDEQKDSNALDREFADEQILPNAEHSNDEDEFPTPIVEQMKELGLFRVTIPEEYGCMGLDLTYVMIVEELSRGWIAISEIMNTHLSASYLLMKFGSFIVPRPLKKMGYKGVESTELVFDGYKCPAENILGGEEAGLNRSPPSAPPANSPTRSPNRRPSLMPSSPHSKPIARSTATAARLTATDDRSNTRRRRPA